MTAGEVLIERSGPGGIHLLNGLYDAKARSPAGPCHHRTAVSRRASVACQDHSRSGAALRRVTGPWRAESRKDRADGRIGKSKRDDFEPRGAIPTINETLRLSLDVKHPVHRRGILFLQQSDSDVVHRNPAWGFPIAFAVVSMPVKHQIRSDAIHDLGQP